MERCADAPMITCPYALVDRNGFEAAIFAVVDPDLLSNVGMLNASWHNVRNPRWDTAAQVTAADFALLQTLEFCNADEACRKAPKILMAQMSYARATQLLGSGQFSKVFDVVLTEASKEHDSGTLETKYQGDTPRFALTPPDPGSDDTLLEIVPRVYVATIKKSQPSTAMDRSACLSAKPDAGACWSLRNTPAPSETRLASHAPPNPPPALAKGPDH
jgi:hypothetical protein